MVSGAPVLTVWRRRLWFFLFVGMAAVHFYPRVRDFVLSIEVTPAERGSQVALRAGCFNCHGPDGTGGVKNPGSEDGEVPGFAGGTPMMWAKSEGELRDYILDGAPARKRDNPTYKKQMESQLLAMPAYHGYLGDAEVHELIVYIRAVSGLITPKDEVAAQGQDLAVRFGCFHCHGPMGAGSTSRNPGSLKNYIPGWWGNDFRELVRNDDELRDWIRDGEIARLRDHPIAKYFIRWQRVYMPAYKDFLTDQQLQALMRYVRWVNQGDWQNTPLDLGH